MSNGILRMVPITTVFVRTLRICIKFCYKDWQGEKKWHTKRGFATKREAVQYERDFLIRKSGDTDMIFGEFIKVYREDRSPRIKESTAAMKDNIIDTKLLPFFGKKRLRDISTKDILSWQNVMLNYRDPETRKPYSKSYLKTIHNQLSAVFNHAVRFYQLKENPAATVGNMGSEKGIRVGELQALFPADLDLEKKTVTVSKTFQHLNGRDLITEPKTPKSNRVVAMPDFLVEEMKDYLKMCYDLKPTDRLFPITKSYLHHKMRSACKKLGLKRIRIHDLRHSHVSLLIDMGYNAVAIAERMGHESIDITYRYAHLFPTVQSDMANKLNNLMEEGENV